MSRRVEVEGPVEGPVGRGERTVQRVLEGPALILCELGDVPMKIFGLWWVAQLAGRRWEEEG
jgi:hypothetical protein